MTYTVIGVYEDNLQGGCFHVEANSSTEAVAALERRDTPETEHIAHDFIVLVTLPGAQFNEYSAPDESPTFEQPRPLPNYLRWGGARLPAGRPRSTAIQAPRGSSGHRPA